MDNTKHWQKWRGRGTFTHGVMGDRCQAGGHLPAPVNEPTPMAQASTGDMIPSSCAQVPTGQHVYRGGTDGSRALEGTYEAVMKRINK